MRQLTIAVMLMSSAVVFSLVKARSQEGAAPEAAVAPRSPHQAAFERAYRLKEQKRDAQALAAFNAILKKDPGNHAALTEAGYLHASLKHYDSAVKHLAAASAQDPGNMRLRMDLGYAHQALKQYGAANEQFQIVAAKPGEFQAPALGASAEARRLLAAGHPAEAKRQALMARGYDALKRGDKAAARGAFSAILAANPIDEPARKQLGFMNFEEGKLEAAASDFEAVRALQPNDHLVALQLGYTYDRLNKKERARAAFAAALESSDAKIREAAQTALQASAVPAPTSIFPQ